MKHIVILSGAGISAESGLDTFRDFDGLWRNYRPEELATPQAWNRDPQLVLDFYNWRRKKLFEVEPNAAHYALTRLEKKFKTTIITQNVDDLHERAGSKQVVHLHGELKKARSTMNPALVYELKHWELKWGDLCEEGHQLRPHVVWFGEAVPMMEKAVEIIQTADYLIVVGTSMVVYPAASLVNFVDHAIPKFYVDPNAFPISGIDNLKIIQKMAGEGIPELVDNLINE